MRPPLLLTLFERLLSADDRREIGGDLEEAYRGRLAAHGRWSARLWLSRQLVTLPFWLLLARMERLAGPVGTRHGDPFMTSRANDLRHALRHLLRTPTFSLVTVLTLAVAVAANTAIYSIVDAVLLESLPYEDADRLVTVEHSAPGVNIERIGTAAGLQWFYRENVRGLESLAGYQPTTTNLTGEGDPVRAEALLVTPSLFDVLRVAPAMGRAFTEEEAVPGGPRLVLLTHPFWVSHFGSDPGVLGRTVRLGGTASEVIGVMPEEFEFPEPGIELVMPLRIDRSATGFGGFNIQGVGRLAEDATEESVEREITALFPRVGETFDDLTSELIESARLAVDIVDLKTATVGPLRTVLWILMGTVGFVLLIACANIGNLFLARAERRQKEVAVRTAMGAGRADLFWQFAVESSILAVASAVLGVALAHAGLEVLVASAPGELPRLSAVGIDGSVLAFTAAISFGAAFLFGTIPMLRHALATPGGVLRDGSRGSTGGKARRRGREILVASQVAFALVLLVGSGLMVKSFQRLLDVDLGFEPTNALTFRVGLPASSYPDVASVARFHRQALDRLADVPGVAAVGAVSRLPVSGNAWSADPLNIEDRPLGPNEIPPVIPLKTASEEYFETMGIRLVEGRAFTSTDVEGRLPVAIVNQALADRFWPGESPLGKRIMQGLPGTGVFSEIVGVVANTPVLTLTDPPQSLVYYSVAPAEGTNVDWASRGLEYVVRGAAAGPESLLPAVRDALRALDPNLPIAVPRTLEAHLEQGRIQMSFTMMLLSIAAVMGLLLGAVGIYGVISYVTAMRTREIGVRMALGAQASTVRAMVLRQGAGVGLLGVALGLGGALFLTRFMEAILFDVSATDPATFAGVSVLLFAVSMLATWVPARRAAGTAPLQALRED